jgi:hypothetical protein
LTEVCFAGKEATEPSVGVFDAALLPGTMWIAEVRMDTEGLAELVMVGELGAFVLREGSAELLGQAGESGAQLLVGWLGLSVGGLIEKDEAGVALLCDRDGLTVLAEQDVVGFPVSWLAAGVDIVWALADEPRSGPASSPGLFLGVGGFVTKLGSGLSLQFARDGRWRAIQSCRDWADRLLAFMKASNRAPVFETEAGRNVGPLQHLSRLRWLDQRLAG